MGDSKEQRSWGRDLQRGKPWDRKGWDKRRIYSCLNCGELGHFHRNCQNAVTSYGVIAINFGEECRGSAVPDTTYTCEKHAEAPRLPFTLQSSKKMRVDWRGDPMFLLVQRKNSMGFVDLLRGKYCVPSWTREQQDACMRTHIQELTCEERELIGRMTFDQIWAYLWINHSSHAFRREYEAAKKLFYEREVAHHVASEECRYHMTELEVPKGRRQVTEAPISCAVREFLEESGYQESDIKMLDIRPVVEEFEGTNSIKYRHVYYFCHLRSGASLPTLDPANEMQAGEIRNLGWFNLRDCEALFRPYNTVKLDLLRSVVTDVVPLIREMVRKHVQNSN